MKKSLLIIAVSASLLTACGTPWKYSGENWQTFANPTSRSVTYKICGDAGNPTGASKARWRVTGSGTDLFLDAANKLESENARGLEIMPGGTTHTGRYAKSWAPFMKCK